MNHKKTIKTILFASLIAAMILPFSGMNMAEAATEESAYKKIIKQQESIKNKSDADKAKFDKFVQDSLDNASPYNKAVNKILEKLSKVTLKIQDAELKGTDTTKLLQEHSAIIFDLENYGVVSEKRLLENPDYWHERAYNASVEIAKGNEVKISLESKSDSTLYNIHTDDVSLKNQAQVDYICFTWPINIYCPNIDVEWGGGSNAHASQSLVYDGRVYMIGKICLEDDGGHDKVYFTFDTEHYVKNLFGTTVFSDTNGPSYNWLQTEGWCASFTENMSNASAGSTAHAESHLDSTVTVTG